MNKIVVAIILYAFFVAIAKGGVVDNTTKIVEIHDIYFVGENVVVKTNFEPGKSFIVDPKGEKIPLNFTSQNRTFFAEFELKKNVLIGRYTLILDEIQKDFVVDFCELNFSYEEGLLNLTAKTFFAEPRIRYSVGPLQGEGVALVSIPLEAGEHEFVAECGKSVLKGNVSVNFSIVYDGVVFAVLDGKAVNATLKVENYEFQGNFDPRKLNLTKFRVKAEYKHLRTSKEFDLSLGLREVYFPKEKIVIKADFAEKGKLIDPTGKVHELTFKDGVAEFELSKEIVLGVYKVVVGSVERSFYVDSYEISTSFDGEKVKGNVSWHFIAPRFVEVVTKNESFKVELVNDTFEFKIDEDALIKCGNAEVIVKKKSVELRDYYFLGDVVEVKVNFDAEKGKVLAPWGESLLEFKNRSAEFFANETGMYKVIVDGIAREFVVDNCELNASFDGKKIIGKAKCVYRAPEVYYNISGIEGSAKVVNGSFEITDLPTGSHTAILKCGNAQISLELKVLEPKEIVLRDLYFLGDEVEINLRFAPEKALLTTPSKSFELNFTKMNESYVAKFVVEEIGKHRVEIDNVTKDFVVDNYRVNATILDQKVVGNVSWDFVKPEFVEFRSALGEGKVNISESGDFEIPIGENWEFLELKCGNSVMKLIERKIFVKEIFFVGEEVEVVANFKPNESYLIFGNESSEVEFEEANGSFVYKFIAEKPGIYELRVDDVEKKIFVDSCKLNATILDRKVAGNVSTIFSRISSLGLVLQPLNVSSFVEVRNGTFEFQLPKNVSEVVLICKNSVLRLKVERAKVSDFRSVEVEGMKFNFSIDKGKFEDLSFDGENLSFVISGLNQGEEVSLGISLPFEIPEALHLYYWKEVDGKSFAVDYSLGEDRKSVVLKLKDGEDEDGTANGVIVDPLKLYVPKLKVEKLIDGKKGLLRIEKEKEKSLEIKVESSGMIKYLAFVDAENLPSKPVDFPYGLLKFEIEVNRGDEAEIRITYPSLQDMIDDNGKAKFYKFNPKTLEWSVFDAEVENNTVILRFKDGGFGDEDGVADGVISDDGGVGWAGYAGLYGASICRDEKTNETHTYWIYVPSGDSFNISVYDGDGFIVRVYYPNGTLYGSYTAPSNNAWNNFIINTNLAFGWWKLEIFEDSWPSNNGNYYGLRVNGTDDINIRVNHSYSVGTTIMYGTPDSVIVGEETSLNISQNYYVFADSFLVAIYDPDGTPRRPALRIDVTSPDGQSSSWTPSDNDVWATQTFSGTLGVWRITVTQIRDFNDYTAGGNHYRLAVNLSDGLYFKPPKLMNINGRVLHDLYPLGRNESEDIGIRGVEVLFVEDRNGNGVPDNGDRVLRRNYTDANGNFSFTAVKDITRTYFVVVNSKTINATNASLSYNSGFDINYVWAEQSYQSNESDYSEVIWFFGGRDANRSDNVSVSSNTFSGIAEHYVKINPSSYNEETIYFGFNFSVVVNGIDEDHDTANPRYCQGCLRQFVTNANAIQGKQRSYFVMAIEANEIDGNAKWWRIDLNSTLGAIGISEALDLNATVLNPSMEVNDTNPGFVTYDYTSKSLVSVPTQTEIPVGVGDDGIPFSGDEEKLRAIPKPEIEIYGGALNPIFNVTSTATGVEFRDFAVFGSQSNTYPGAIRVYGNDFVAENVFAGLRANGTDPKLSGLNRTGGANFWIEGNNSTVKNSIIAFAERYGLLFYTSNVKAGKAENVIGFRNGLIFDGGDNFGAENLASNVTFSICLSAKASANGIESNTALEGISVQNCTVETNGIGNETGAISEIAGVRINANNSLVKNNLIRENGIGILVSNRYNDTATKQVFNVTITKNAIYNNSKLGIDLANGSDFAIAFRGDNVTLNDGALNCNQPNCGMDYPVITYVEFDETENELYVEGFIGKEDVGGSSAFASAKIEIYLVNNSTQGDNLIGNNWSYTSQLANHYGEGYIYLGELYANATGYFNGSINVAGKGVELNSLITATATLNGTSEFGPNYLLRKRINISAEITIENMGATIRVKAFEKAKSVKVYWKKPSGLVVASMSGDYIDNGSSDGIYWWKFNLNAGEEKFVYLKLSGSDFSMLEAFNIGVDP